MKKVFSIAVLVSTVIIVWSCNKEKDTVTPATTVYVDLPAKTDVYYNSLSINMGLPPDSLNRIATLGRVLFYDTRLSMNNGVACASCHKQELGFADNAQFSRGFEGKLTGRNSPGINGLFPSGFLFWDGREQVLNNLIMRPISNHVEMGMDDLTELPARLSKLSYYAPLFKKAFGSEEVTLDKVSMAVSTFVRAIGGISLTKPFINDTAGMSALQIKGKLLFDTVYNCGSCHIGGGNGGYGGSSELLDIGLDAVYTDKGRGAISGQKMDMGKFKVPGLTNVAVTAPYMHDGRYKSLNEVLEHYSHNISNSPNLSERLRDKQGQARRMNITESDKKAIIAFLGTLTDHNTNSDPKFANPFKVK